MALIIKDRVKEGTASTGTGSISLVSASATFDAFGSVMTNGDTTYYAIVHTSSGVDEWEVGLGTWNTGNTLSRTTVLAGSGGTSAVNFSAGTKDVFMTYPSAIAAYTDGSGDLSSLIGLGNHTTTDLAEGSNLYFNTGRIDSHLSGGTGVTYNAGAISIGQAVATTSNVAFNTVTLSGDITVPNLITSGNVDGRDVSVDGTKLDGIEAGATADQTITAGGGITGGGTGNVTISHADTSAQASLTALTGANVVSDIDVDTYGHVTALATRAMTAADLGALTSNQTITLSGDLTGSGTTSISAQIAANVVGANELNVTGNGTATQFLRSDGDGTFTWAVPTDTNTTYAAGTGLSLTGTTFANTAPDQTVSLTQGGATTISGTYPNFTISSTDTNTTYTAGTGLALTGTVFSNTITNNNQLTNGAAYVDNAGVDTHLNTGTATTGEVLSWTGTDYDWIAAGGLPELYAENPSSPTAPSATGTNAVAIGNGSKAASTDAIGLGVGSWARSDRTFAVFGDAQPSSIGAVAIGYSTVAIGVGAVSLGQDAYGLAAGAVALGKSRASGTDSFAAAIDNNTATYGATGANSVAIGELAKATGANSFACGNSAIASSAHGVAIGDRAEATGTQYSVAIGGDNPEASDQYAVVIGGWANRVTNDYSVIVGGYNNTVTGQRSFVGGGRENSISSDYTAAFGFRVNSRADYSLMLGSDQFNVAGGSQVGRYILSCATTDATLTQMTSGGAAAASQTFFQIPNASAATFSGLIVGRQQNASGTDCVAFRIEGLLVRGTGAGTTSLVNSATTVIDNTPAWGGVTLSADTTLGGLKVEVTGAAATNIRWVCNLDTSEVIYT